jgi:hypothetical protein
LDEKLFRAGYTFALRQMTAKNRHPGVTHECRRAQFL